MSGEQMGEMSWACGHGRVREVGQLLKEEPILLNAPLDGNGSTPLLCASYNASMEGQIEVVKLLLASNADPNKQDKYGNTPLYCASSDGATEVVRLLLAYNADPNLQKKDGRKPGETFYSRVAEATKQEIQELLEKERKKRKEVQQQKSTTSSSSSSSISSPSSAASSSPSPSSPFIGSTPPSLSSTSPASSSSSSSSSISSSAASSSQNFDKGSGSTTSSFGSTSTSPSTLSSPSSSASSSTKKKEEKERKRKEKKRKEKKRKGKSASSSSPKVSETQEAERIGAIKCKFGEDAARFSVTKTTTFEELIAMVEGEWGEGKGLKYKDCDGDWLKMKNNDDVVEVWNQTKSGVVTLKVFSQKNQSSSSSSLPTTNSSSSTPTSSTTQTPSPGASSATSSSLNSSRTDDVAKEDLNNSLPIKGVWDKPLLSFEEAVQIANVPTLDIDDVYSCLEHFEDVENPPPGLTVDEACAVRFYTMETPFYGAFNSALRTRDRNESKCFFPFLQLLLLAMHKLPKSKGTLFRGTRNLPVDVIDEYKRKAETKKCIFWGACSSTTTSVKTLSNPMFCGKEGNRVKFVIQDCDLGVSVQALSAIGVEKEVLLPPCLRFVVEDYVDLGNGLLEFQLRYSAPRREVIPLVPPPQFLSSSAP